MAPSYRVKITSYEELEDKEGHIFTVYNVLVEETSTKKFWQIRKRYKHFAYLFNSLKDQYEEVERFRFPNKSMFNTFSQFTKERRRAGFEDFMNMVVRISPMPVEVEEFLELDDHMWPAPPTESATVAPVASNAAVAADLPVVAPVTALPTSHTDLPTLLKHTFLVTMIIYAISVVIGIIDVTNTSLGKILLTMVSLAATVSLLRIISIKNNIKNRIQDSPRSAS